MQEQISGEQSPKKKLGRSVAFVAANVAVMLVIVAVISFVVVPDWLNRITGHDNFVTVPDVRGLSADEAMMQIEICNLTPMIIDTVFSDGHTAGEVLEQLPEGNMPVKPGRLVYLTINSYTTQMFAFPDVNELSSRQARSNLEDQFFVVDSIMLVPYEFDDLVVKATQSDGRTEMKPGEMYPKRTHVILQVGSTQVGLEAENDENEEQFFE